MAAPKLTKNRIRTALVVAVLADLLQVTFTLGEATVIGAPAGEAGDILMDVIVFFIMTRLIGFHWLLLPSFVVEVIPGLDLLPTWTGCTVLVIRQRKHDELTESKADRVVIDVTPRGANASPVPSLPSPDSTERLP